MAYKKVHQRRWPEWSVFDYAATQVDELTIKVDDMVEVITKDPTEPGW